MPLAQRLRIEKRNGYVLAVDPAAPSWIATNDDGAWVLRQLRAGTPRDDISYRFARRVGVSLARALQLVAPFADEVAEFASPRTVPPTAGGRAICSPTG